MVELLSTERRDAADRHRDIWVDLSTGGDKLIALAYSKRIPTIQIIDNPGFCTQMPPTPPPTPPPRSMVRCNHIY